MRRMVRGSRCNSFAILAAVLLGACNTGGGNAARPSGAVARADAESQPRNIILLIGDGLGNAYWSAARVAGDSLAVAEMPVVGLVDTRGADHPRVTDSAAGATAYATGRRSYNGAISVGVGCRELVRRDSAAVAQDPAACDPLENAFEVARRRGMATGLVTTTRITDATPAAFGAHAPSRRMEAEIAEQYLRNGVDVLLGGGRDFFDGSARADSSDLLAEYCSRAACLATASDLGMYRPDDRPVVGLFAPLGMPVAAERSPSLVEMTRAALAKLSRGSQGFVLLVEEEGTDDAGHGNVPLSGVVAEVRSLNRAVAASLEFARANPGTLVIVTADHETGGLSLRPEGDSLVAAYSTTGHTPEMVPLFAFGPGAERFAGIRDNEEIGQILLDLIRSAGASAR